MANTPKSPPPEKSPKSPPAAAADEKPAAASSTASSAATSSPFIADPGPAHDPDAAGAQEPAELYSIDGGRLPPEEWQEDRVRRILTAKGAVLHGYVGVGQQDWLYTESDLQAIAPPLTAILNRYDVTRAAAHTGDELALLIGLGGYVGRSYRERRAVLTELAAQEPEPISGVPADDGAADLSGIHHQTPEEGNTPWTP